jgi:hypothetical protein
MSTRSSYLAACIQAAPVSFDVALTVQKVGDLTPDAARQGAASCFFLKRLYRPIRAVHPSAL